MTLRFYLCALVFLLFGFTGAALADIQVPRTAAEEEDMQQKLELRRKEREVGKAFHDKTVVSREEVLKFIAQRQQLMIQKNEKLQEVMSAPPTNFPHYAACLAAGRAREKANAMSLTLGKTIIWASALVIVLALGAWIVAKINAMSRAFDEKEKKRRFR